MNDSVSVNPNDLPLWVLELGSGLQSTMDRAERVAIDPSGNVFVGGRMWDVGSSAYRARIIKLDGLTGSTISSAFLPNSTVSGFSPHYVRDLAVDAAGNLVMAFGSGTGLFTVVKLDGTDLIQTLWTYTESTSLSGQSFDVVLDGNGDVLAGGTLDTAFPPYQAVVVKLDGDTGVEIWKNDTLPAAKVWHGQLCGSPPTGPLYVDCGSPSPTSLLVTGDGDAVILAEQADGDAYVARLQAGDGVPAWQGTVPDLHPRSIASDGTTAVYVTGSAGADYLEFGIAAVDLASGVLSWSMTYGLGYPKDIDVTGEGKPAATGTLHDPILGDDRFGVVTAEPLNGVEAWRFYAVSIWGDGASISVTPIGQLVAGGASVGTWTDSETEPPTVYYTASAAAVRLQSSNGSPGYDGPCGDGELNNENEECDDGNLLNGDCCSSSCHWDPATTACDDGRACSTVDQCDGAGHCQPMAGDCCGDGTFDPTLGEECDVSVSCCVSCSVDVGAACTYNQYPQCHPTGVCGERFLGEAYCYPGPNVCDCCTARPQLHGGGCNQPACESCVVNNAGNSCLSFWDSYCAAIANSATCASSCNCQGTTTTTTPTTSTTTTTLPPFACPATPGGECLVPGGASLQVRDNGDDAKDQIKWKWKKGPQVIASNLGNPRSTTTYGLCIYDSTGGVDSLVTSLTILPSARWLPRAQGDFDYKDLPGSQSGVTKGQLRIGDAGKSKAQIRAKGVNIPMPAPTSGTEFFDQDGRVTVQLRNNQTSTCWTSEFTSATRNISTQYKTRF